MSSRTALNIGVILVQHFRVIQPMDILDFDKTDRGNKYENISSEDLEYRAKLVELIYSKERNLLEMFAHEADNSSKNNGHSLAASRIIGEFSKKLNLGHDELSITKIQTVARELFEESEMLLSDIL